MDRGELNKLIFGDLLDADLLGKLGNIDLGIEEEDLMGDNNANRGRGQIKVGAQSQKQQQARMQQRESQSEERSQSAAGESFNAESDNDDGGDVVKSDRDSFQVESDEGGDKSSFADGEMMDSPNKNQEDNDGFEDARRQVQFEELDGQQDMDQSAAPTQISQTKGVELPVLWRNERQGEIVYRLTELYRYTNPSQRQKSLQFVHDIMRTQNDDDCDYLKSREARNLRRDIKADLKNAREKIKHQIKYCPVPNNIIEEAMYRYRPMNARELTRMKMGNRYENAPHIARIIPFKRPQQMSVEQTQRVAQLQEKERQQKEEDQKLKLYIQPSEYDMKLDFSLMELAKDPFDDGTCNDQHKPTQKEIDDLFGTTLNPNQSSAPTTLTATSNQDHSMDHTSQINEQEEQKLHDNLAIIPAKPDEQKALEIKYIAVRDKIREKELSLTDITSDERIVIKKYLKAMSTSLVESKYPSKVAGMNREQKLAFTFMKNINPMSFSYRGQHSMLQSDNLNGELLDDDDQFVPANTNSALLLSAHHNTNPLFEYISDVPMAIKPSSNKHPIFSLNETSGGDLIPGRKFFGDVQPFDLQMNDNNQASPQHKEHKKEVLYNGATDLQILQWYQDQKCQLTKNSQQPYKRRRYWGEPQDCSSLMQITNDNCLWQKHQNRLYHQRGNSDETVFNVIFEDERSKRGGGGNQRPLGNQMLFGALKAPGKPEDKKNALMTQGQQKIPIKDQKEYEFLERERAKFYRETNPFKEITGPLASQQQIDSQTRNMNAIMRRIAFVAGEITEEEFYAQEALEDQLDYQQTAIYQNKASLTNQFQPSRHPQQNMSMMKILSNPALADHQSENYDLHFELTKKDRHDKLMLRIQQQEKQNQPSSTTTQTLAYASGKDVLLKVGGNHLQSSVQVDKQKGMDMKSGSKGGDNGYNGEREPGEDEDMDEDGQERGSMSLEKNTSASSMNSAANKNHKENEGITAEDDMKRVTKSRANELNHAKCILKLTYTKFEWSDRELLNFHRPNIQDIFEISIMENARANGAITEYSPIDGRLIIKTDPLKPQPPFISSIPMKVLTNEYIEKKSKKIGINAHEYFKDRFKLSLKDGRYCLFEHVDQRPLFINNFGMASKLKRYVYSDQPLPQTAFTRRSENKELRHMGPYGIQVLKKRGEKIPLLGQIDNSRKGITVLENNMYYCPVFYHKAHKNDFLCVMHQDKHGNQQVYVRELQELYLMGQIEPKTNMEVYNPQSRTYQHFIKRRTQAYVIRFLQENNNTISFSELNRFFSYINDQILKKIIKEINVEVDRNQTCSLAQECKDEQFRQLITPENICQYESAQFGEQMLKKVGIREITNADKISYATNKFCSEETDLRKQLIARIIEEEVLSTPWNLSQNFNHNRQQRGMMMLEGIGDPSNGHGGYSYLKLPLKISQDSLNKAKINRMYLNPAIQNPKAVTGTDADLRKLSKSDIQHKLVNLGYKKETIEQFSRWQMVALLRDRSSLAVTQGAEGEMKKFARGVRFTSKKQREMYQKQVNEIFKKQINYLQLEQAEQLNDISDSESKDQRQKKFKEMQQINQNNSKSIVELKQDIEVKRIQDIPGYEILLMNSLAQGAAGPAAGPNQPGLAGILHGGATASATFQGFDDREAAKRALKEKIEKDGLTLECVILRKKIKPVRNNGGDGGEKQSDKIERVIFCSDHRQIKGFKKRKHKHEVKTKRTKKTSLKEKMQTSKPFLETLNQHKRESETHSSFLQPALRQSRGGDNLTQTSISHASAHHKHSSSPVKIKIGANALPAQQAPPKEQTIKVNQKTISIPSVPTTSNFKINLSNLPAQNYPVNDSLNQHGFQNQGPMMMGCQSIQGDVSMTQSYGGNTIRLQPQPQHISQPHSGSGAVRIGLTPSVNTSADKISFPNIVQQQPQQKISISLGGITTAPPMSQPRLSSYYEEEKQPVRQSVTFAQPAQKTSSKAKTPAQTTTQSAKQPASGGGGGSGSNSSRTKQATENEDYEDNLYKPRQQQNNRRRSQQFESLLNEIFEIIVDSCIKQDKSKIFFQAVKKKDVPNYYDIVKTPIDLTQIKNKAKRLEYFSLDQFMADIDLLLTNSITFNGQEHQVTKLAFDLVNHALQKVNERRDDIESLQMLVKEKLDQGFLRSTPPI